MKRSLLNIKNTTIKSNHPDISALFFAILSGVLLFLSFPRYGSGIIAWIALIPFFWMLTQKNLSIFRGFIFGFVTGLVFHIGIIYWIAYVVVNYGYLPLYQGIILMLLLACYLSLYTALFAAGIVLLRGKIALCLAAPALWICLEYCKSQLFSGFPWENLGYSQYLNANIIQISDIAGVFGISFLIVLTNTVLFELICHRSKKQIYSAVVVILIMISVFIYGVNRSEQIRKLMQNKEGTEISLIQGNIDQSIKWNENFQKTTISIYEELTLKNAPAAGNLIVWPETALPFNYQDENTPYHKKVTDIALKTKNWFIFGSTSYEKAKTEVNYYNSAYLLSPSGRIQGKYDKVHLVPYGEYVPLRNIFPFIKKLTAGMGDFAAGNGFRFLEIDGRKIGILICYEGILPLAARTYKKDGVQLLINITNDAWFGATSAPYQHFSMAVFRSVETRLYLVRAANTGISAIVDPLGNIVATTKIFEKTALNGNIKYSDIPTIYAKYGDVLVIVCFIFIISCLGLVMKKRRNKNAG